MILRCWYIDEWMQLVDKLGQQEAVMVVIINKVATRQGLWQVPIGRHFNFLMSLIVRPYTSETRPALCMHKPS